VTLKQVKYIETFFQWIKQNLRIKTFIGTSKNAVKTQIWIAMIVYLIIWYIKQQSKFAGSLLTLIRVINVNLFYRVHLFDILASKPPISNIHKPFVQLSFGFG